MIPLYGTYLEGKDFVENPSWSQAGWVAASALGDAATLFGVGALGKGAIAAAKAAKASKAGKAAYEAAKIAEATKTANAAKAAATAKRANDVVTSVTLMNRPMSEIVKYQKAANAARDAYKAADIERAVARGTSKVLEPWTFTPVKQAAAYEFEPYAKAAFQGATAGIGTSSATTGARFLAE